MIKNKLPENEFSRLYAPEKLNRRKQSLSLKAKEEERAALAERFSFVSLDALEGDLTLEPNEAGDLLMVRGLLRASVVQSCILSGQPLQKQLEEPFEILYSFTPVDEEEDIIIDIAAEDPPEVVGPEGVDFGECLAQHLAVALDPYPKAPDAVWSGESLDETPKEEEVKRTSNPFAVLKGLKKD